MADSRWRRWIEGTLEFLPRDFTTADAYRFIPYLQKRAPANRHVAAKIRQQLQDLVAAGRLYRLEKGTYRQADASSHAPDWPFHVGDRVTRADVADALGLPDYTIPRGMFKPARGPSSKRMVLFSNLTTNPYGDRRDGDRFIYTGERGRHEGKLEGFNRYLAEHTELGIEVHLFITDHQEPTVNHYEGPVIVESWREVFRPNEGRNYFEFVLVPAASANVGAEILGTVEANLDFHLAARTKRESVAIRAIRDRSFRDVLIPAYDSKCAVCGPSLQRANHVDIQAAHILAVEDDGPDTPTNGIAFCIRHHWAFDHGVFTLTDGLEVTLPDRFDDPHRELRHGAPVRRPIIDEWTPRPEFISLHRKKWGF